MTESQSSPTWIELSVLADAESVESVAELFRRHGYNDGVVIEEAYRQDEDGENFRIDPSRPVTVRTFLPDDSDAPHRRGQLEEGLWHLRQLGQVGQVVERIIQEDDWESAWKQHFPVLRIGRRFVIKPSWQEYEPRDGDLVIHLDPGMAFGTGSHPTTEMCLQAIETLDLRGASVLDAGSGSGILSIAACIAGASSVNAVEIDPYAGRTLQANLVLNGVDDRVTVTIGPVGSAVDEASSYDVVLANIIARVLIEDAAALARSAAASGALIASGIIAEREREVIETYAAEGMVVSARRSAGDWVTLVLVRSSA